MNTGCSRNVCAPFPIKPNCSETLRQCIENTHFLLRKSKITKSGQRHYITSPNQLQCFCSHWRYLSRYSSLPEPSAGKHGVAVGKRSQHSSWQSFAFGVAVGPVLVFGIMVGIWARSKSTQQNKCPNVFLRGTSQWHARNMYVTVVFLRIYCTKTR